MLCLAFGLSSSLALLPLVPLMNVDNDKKRITLAINTMLAVNLVGDLLVALLMNGNMFALVLVASMGYLCSFGVLLFHFAKSNLFEMNQLIIQI